MIRTGLEFRKLGRVEERLASLVHHLYPVNSEFGLVVSGLGDRPNPARNTLTVKENLFDDTLVAPQMFWGDVHPQLELTPQSSLHVLCGGFRILSVVHINVVSLQGTLCDFDGDVDAVIEPREEVRMVVHPAVGRWALWAKRVTGRELMKRIGGISDGEVWCGRNVGRTESAGDVAHLRDR